MFFHRFFEYSWFLNGKWRIIDTWDVFSGGQMMKIFSKRRKLFFSQLLLILLTFDSLSLSKLFQLFLKFLIFLLERKQFLLSKIEIMNILADKEPPKNFLNHDGLLGKVTQIFVIVILHFFYPEFLFGIKNSKNCLNTNRSSLLFFELFPLNIHSIA